MEVRVTGEVLMKIVGRADGRSTVHDGEFLAREWTMGKNLMTTPDASKARIFKNSDTMLDFWRQNILVGYTVRSIPCKEVRMKPTKVCDFCSLDGPVWDYPCEDFTIRIMGVGEDGGSRIQDHTSREGWLACQPCATLIDANDRAGLMARAMLRQPGRHRALIREALKPWHDEFFAHRQGPPSRWE